MTPQQESITKATQCSDLLTSDIREAHKLACAGDRLLELALRELSADAMHINRKLAELEGCLR